METTAVSEGTTRARRKLPWGRTVAALAAVAALVLVGRQAGGALPQIATAVEGLGAWGPIVFVAAYALATVLFVPGSILTLAAGALFGLGLGTTYAFTAALIGSSAAFLIARYAARGAIERRIAGSPRFSAIDRAIAEDGRKIVFLLRLSPVFPFSLLNYALGLTRVRFVDYVAASVGMLPGTVLYVYYGKLIGDVAQLASGVEVERGPLDWAVLGLGLAATIAVTAVVTRSARRALRERTGEAEATR